MLQKKIRKLFQTAKIYFELEFYTVVVLYLLTKSR